ncbi:hypothetical protein PACTADRAFT_3413 [Pachysolen tannophilus NRRL Y-2460]|uniref:DDHD domain-containing protein n=1 Tax=Pachysolen tannophilus NRRL Y-2460 TaxID=669874 RepID=A0A1E4TS17_PACTA|nr:hypothetical protein PACTADRAFT_3413 [Pachysolen tannophilus NRRL Y-2460]
MLKASKFYTNFRSCVASISSETIHFSHNLVRNQVKLSRICFYRGIAFSKKRSNNGWYISNNTGIRNVSCGCVKEKITDDGLVFGGGGKTVNVRWFYATDIPNSKPFLQFYERKEDPKKFLPFSSEDSKILEEQYQKYLTFKKNGNVKSSDLIPGFPLNLVPVNEDRLFECDLNLLEMKPIYWEGNSYEIRRGLWFNKDGVPVSKELSNELEQGYQDLVINTNIIEKNFKDIEKISKKIVLKSKEDKRKDLKMVVYGKDNTAYIIPDHSFARFQASYLTKAPPAALLGVEKFTRGYQKDKAKENESERQTNDDSLLNNYQQEILNVLKLEVKPKNDDALKKVIPNELENDYKNKSSNENSRQIDHLVICVHGIGQILGTKFESINFIHSINVLRKTMKTIFKESEELQKIAYPNVEFTKTSPNYDPKLIKNIKENCKVQVLPILWRNKIDFDKSVKDHVSKLPTLSEITIDTVRPLRNILGDILLDVLLYYEPRYLNMILDEVTTQINDVYATYLKKNPGFEGKVSFVGHSLGSAILFDILARQPDHVNLHSDKDKILNFEVENFFAVGSPIGVFKLLKHCNIGPRELNPFNGESDVKSLASPKVKNFYNVFHPCDPVGYRIEPLIDREFANYKPAIIPFASKNIDSQLKDLSEYGDQLTSKVLQNLNSVISNIALLKSKAESDAKNNNSETAQNSLVSPRALQIMTKCNYSGRVDYSLPEGIFDISLFSAIGSHVSYFEEPNISGFLLNQLLTKKESVKDKSVTLLNTNSDDETLRKLKF